MVVNYSIKLVKLLIFISKSIKFECRKVAIIVIAIKLVITFTSYTKFSRMLPTLVGILFTRTCTEIASFEMSLDVFI